jgi:hypothetical protein
LSGTLLATTNSSGVANLLNTQRKQDWRRLRAESHKSKRAARFTNICVVPHRRNIVVTSVADSGPGTLRQAILDANANVNFKDTIKFNVPTTTISPTTPLPAITDPLVISASLGNPVNRALCSTERPPEPEPWARYRYGQQRHRRSRDPTVPSERNIDSGCWRKCHPRELHGLSGDGSAAAGNLGNGIQVIDSPNNVIGGDGGGTGNFVGANAGEGIRIDGAAATGNLIQGNTVGAGPVEGSQLGNSASGIFIRRAPGNSVIGNHVEFNGGFAAWRFAAMLVASAVDSILATRTATATAIRCRAISSTITRSEV